MDKQLLDTLNDAAICDEVDATPHRAFSALLL